MASVYTNDLRLEEIGSGEQSGSWGDTTNTNLELIAEAFAFGTEAITTNADTHTTTIADGASDPGRALFLKYTGTLDSACTITIGPNTVSKLWFIENGTSGSQNIIISQGSGANITIPAGQTKAVYSNGGGSGAVMVDAFATLNVVDLLVDDDLTVTDDVAIGGLATVGGTLGVTGVVTANAGVVVDNFTLDGTTLALSSGEFVLDVASAINFNSDTGNFRFQDAAVDVGIIQIANSDFIIRSLVSDKDIIFQGNDGGSTITALTLDMSDAGTAIFNHDISLGDGQFIFLGTGQDMTLQGDGTNGILTTPNGDLTLDVAGDINLDADGGDIYIKDGGTERLRIITGNAGFIDLYSGVSDQDFRIRGNDGGAIVDALTFDMSDAGAASFNKVFKFGSDASGAPYLGSVNRNTLNAAYGNDSDTADLWINYIGYQGGTSRFRDFRIGNGKQAALVFVDGSTSDVTISAGNLVIGTAGKGIDFSAQTIAGGTVQEVLNHYEQGQFTPIFQNSGGEQPNYGHAAGFYVRVGARVQAHGYLSVGNSLQSASGSVQLGGLPYGAVNVTNGHNPVNIGWANSLNITANQNLGGYLGPNTALMQVHLWDAATGTTELQFSELSVNGTLMFFISYNAV